MKPTNAPPQSVFRLALSTPGYVLGDRKLLSLSLLPSFFAGFAFVVLFLGSYRLRDYLLSPPTQLLLKIPYEMFFFLIVLALVGVASLVVLHLFGGWILDFLVSSIYLREGVPIAKSHGFLRATAIGLVYELQRIAILIFLALCLVITGLIPILAPGSLLLSFFILGFEFYDYPLVIREVRFQKRIAMIRKRALLVLVTGACLGALLVIPLIGPICLPLFYAFSTRTISQWPEIYEKAARGSCAVSDGKI